MANNLTDYAENLFLNWAVKGQAISTITGYVALFTSNPGEAGGGTEVSDANYARVALSSYFPTASGSSGSISNNANIEFAAAATGFTATGYALMDAPTGGNMIFYGALTSSVTVGAGEIYRFPVSDLTFQMQ